MLIRDLYYELKPFVPRRLRYALRRHWAKKRRKLHKDVWPIDPSAAKPPNHWPGWPNRKSFAFALSHDVESAEGLLKCRQLAELEMEFGFRSSFNFIPEGPYQVPADLRRWLTDHGFEVGVHDLKHDGKLFRKREDFAANAMRINRYLKEWGAAGFRAGFMHNNLEWQHDIKSDYDASTFDTDPFEPHPTGAGTIFPYWVCKSESEGFIELPYTLAQDSTLFLIFREKSAEIWKTKVDWLAKHGGMALVITHPDYISSTGIHDYSQFPLSYYRDLLTHVRSKYEGRYWHALPREIARYAGQHRDSLDHKRTHVPGKAPPMKGVKIWIDLENTPHIPFFNPIIRELRKRGHTIVITARDAYQTCEMADLYAFKYSKIGRHFGQKMALKAVGLATRSLQLLPFMLRERPAIALNHGSRSQVVAGNILRIPSVTIMDYEHSRGVGLGHPRWLIVPHAVTNGVMGSKGTKNIRHYSGIKEDVYAPEFVPNPAIIDQLNLAGDNVIVITVRPPATEAHYHNPEAEVLFAHFMEQAIKLPEVRVVLLPRNKRQDGEIRARWPHWFSSRQVVIPHGVVDGLNLLWHSDLVVSGGGTMNREAAALGIPVYSIFRGTIGAVDRQLEAEGRLTLIKSVADVTDLIALRRREKTPMLETNPRSTLTEILNHIEAIIALECRP